MWMSEGWQARKGLCGRYGEMMKLLIINAPQYMSQNKVNDIITHVTLNTMNDATLLFGDFHD